MRGGYATWWLLIRNIPSVVHWLYGLHHLRVVCIVFVGKIVGIYSNVPYILEDVYLVEIGIKYNS